MVGKGVALAAFAFANKLLFRNEPAARRIDALLIGIVTPKNQSGEFILCPSGLAPNLPHNIVCNRHGFLAKRAHANA
jgi:hypothetical protein